MKNAIFYLVDVFAAEKYTGNQVAVVKYAGDITTEEMQKIARELYFSETSFICSDKLPNGGYNVRLFTPTEEVPYSGHSTLGTAYIINQILSDKPQKVIQLNLKCGEIPVHIEYQSNNSQTFWMEQIKPTFGQEYNPVLLANILGLDSNDIDDQFPIIEVSTGLPFIITPLKSLRAMKEILINKERYYWLIKRSQAKAILAFSLETNRSENNFNVRVFADYYGIPEDPASGSGNGCLAAYCAKYNVLKNPSNNQTNNTSINLRIEQGYEIGRPSLIFAKASQNQENINVSVGGNIIIVAKGELL